MPRIRDVAGTAVLTILATAMIGELAVRVGKPHPRRVLFRDGIVHNMREVGGVWLWDDVPEGTPPRGAVLEDHACDQANAFRVLVIGDSIFNGVGLPPGDVGSVQLKAALSAHAAPLPVCVINAAVPGYSLYQSITRATDVLQVAPPHLVLLELWGGPPPHPAHHVDTVYFFRGLTRDAMGLANPVGLPPALNGALLHRSALYEYLVLAAPDDCPSCRDDLTPHEPFLDGFVDTVRANGGHIHAYMPSFLTQPFSEAGDRVQRTNADYDAWLARRGIPVTRLWEAFGDHHAPDLALDPVHFNAKGQALLADLWLEHATPVLDAWLDRQATRDGTPAPEP